MNSERPAPDRRDSYRHFHRITTRWMDNDAYGHVNNVVYYSWFDTVVNEYLIREGVLDVNGGAVIGLVVETQCRYFSELAFPQPVDLGLRIGRLGNSSVRYEIGVFADGDIYKSGFQGQGLYVSPETDTVVVFFSTTYNDLPAYARAIVKSGRPKGE